MEGEAKPSAALLHLVAVPFPGRGHINPMLSLCRRLSARSPRLLVTFVVTDEWLDLLSSCTFPPPENVRFKTIPNVVPSEATRGSNYEAFVAAVMFRMGPAVGELVEGLDVPADAVLADALLLWAPEIGARRGIPVAALFPQSATMFFDLQRFSGLRESSSEETAQLNYLPRRSSSHLPEFTGQVDALQLFNKAISWSTTARSHSLLFTSSSALEPLAVNALRSALSLPVLTVGPTVSVPPSGDDASASAACSAWLNARPPRSVLYVSLGSFLPILPPQMDEIVAGLRMSGTAFLLVARGRTAADREPSGGESLVVPWADQVRTLSHPSVGGFLTHCGWNSAMEGVVAGVPMLVFPLMWDQFPNARLVVDEWRIGRRLKGEEGDGLVGREEIARAVKGFMDFDSGEGKAMTRRVGELRERCRLALEEGGSSSDCMRGFVEGLVDKSKK